SLRKFPISDQGFKSWLGNPIFCGHTAYLKTNRVPANKNQQPERNQWDIRFNTHEAIIAKETAQEIQDILSTNRKKRTPVSKTSYLTGLVFCSSCHRTCSFRRSAGRKYYGCQHASTTCDNRGNVSLAKIDQAIIQALTRKAWKIAQEGRVKSDTLISLEDRYQQLLAVPNADTDPILKSAAAELRQKIEAISLQEDILCQRLLSYPQARKINFWYTLTQEERLIFYEKLVNRVETQGKEVCAVILNV
ncbi:MAG TPA: recombinase zinc beta ribbon domain-containing protein, partial [Methanosarcina sp.]|nr:recombinase zinc beta ribbon domain-containing protein [Methanosarcina sp.]